MSAGLTRLLPVEALPVRWQRLAAAVPAVGRFHG
jgi:hypothetical protein